MGEKDKKNNLFKRPFKLPRMLLSFIVFIIVLIIIALISLIVSIDTTEIMNLLIALLTLFTFTTSFLTFLDDNKLKMSFNKHKSLGENSNLAQEINKELTDIEKQLIDNAEESKANAERLFKRSSYSLIVGGVIAFSGVLIFHILNSNINYNEFTDLFHFFGLIPRFGILFFIEYVAFFFLKQYRVLMEEYRYYEAIKRDRQNLLSMYYLADKYKDDKEVLKLLSLYLDKHSADIPKYSGDNRVKMEKSLNEDMDIISKITKMVQVIKTSDKSKE